MANNKTGEKSARDYLADKLDGEVTYIDVTTVNVEECVAKLTEADRVILAGGDGTINRFINTVEKLPCPVDYIPTGSGNDFKTDVGMDGDFIHLDKYMQNLPTVTVNGNTYKFINGIGYGIDGYCCEEGDKQKAKSDKPVNYAGIAVKGLLYATIGFPL